MHINPYIHTCIICTNINAYSASIVGMITVAAVAIFKKVQILNEAEMWSCSFVYEVIFECNYFKR